MIVSGMFLPFEQVDTNGDLDPGVLLSAQTITSETTSTTTTTHITKVRIHLWFSDTPQSVCWFTAEFEARVLKRDDCTSVV